MIGKGGWIGLVSEVWWGEAEEFKVFCSLERQAIKRIEVTISLCQLQLTCNRARPSLHLVAYSNPALASPN